MDGGGALQEIASSFSMHPIAESIGHAIGSCHKRTEVVAKEETGDGNDSWISGRGSIDLQSIFCCDT